MLQSLLHLVRMCWLAAAPRAVVLLTSALLTSALLAGAAAPAQTVTVAPDSAPVAAPAPMPAGEARLVLNHRQVATLRATLLGDAPAVRVALAQAAIEAAAASGSARRVTVTDVGEAQRLEVNGATVLFLVPDDLPTGRAGTALAAAAQQARAHLQLVLDERAEQADPRRLALGTAAAVAATGAAWLLLRGLLALRRQAQGALARRAQAWQAQPVAAAPVNRHAEQLRAALQGAVSAAAWLAGLLLADAWVTFVLHQFAYTRPWAEASSAWLFGVLQQFALGIAGAVPGLLTALLIFGLAHLLTRACGLLLHKVARGEVRLGWLDADTAAPTRWLAVIVIWLFALALAYPHLPGAHSEAFKGVTVLAGLMLSLGASSIVGQALAGLGLMYSRALRVGEYVRIGEVEGTVVSVGALATKVHTGLGEEVSLPSALVFNQPVRNFSRLVADGRFVLQAVVTIGYATPWRQVHALLLEAAARTPGVAQDPAPYVVQTALSDFYVEYRLCAQGNRHAPDRRAEALNALHGHIQDVFNEHGVQIMSPHYLGDPAEPQVVPPSRWYTAPAQGPRAGQSGP